MSDQIILALAKQWIDVEHKRLAIQSRVKAEFEKQKPKCNGDYFLEKALWRKITGKYLSRFESIVAEKEEIEAQLLSAECGVSNV